MAKYLDRKTKRLFEACERGLERLEKWKLTEDIPIEKHQDPFSRKQVLFAQLKHKLEELSL